MDVGRKAIRGCSAIVRKRSRPGAWPMQSEVGKTVSCRGSSIDEVTIGRRMIFDLGLNDGGASQRKMIGFDVRRY